MKRRTSLALAACLALTPVLGMADSFPEKPITLVVPYPAGGTNDVIARALAEKMGLAYGKPVVVENRAGAGGNVGAQSVARATPDGYTLFVSAAGPLSVNKQLYKSIRYDPQKDFAPIALLASVPIMLVANPSAPFKTVAELIAHAKANPGKLSYGSQGNGTTSHLTMEMLKMRAGVNIVHVPYRGSAPATTDLIGGAIQVMFDNSPTTLPHVRSGRAHALGVAAARRVEGMTDIPSISETVSGFQSEAWFGLVAPAGTPAAVIQNLNNVVNKVLADPEMKAQFAKSGVELRGGTAQEFGAFIDREVARWGEIIKAAGVQVD